MEVQGGSFKYNTTGGKFQPKKVSQQQFNAQFNLMDTASTDVSSFNYGPYGQIKTSESAGGTVKVPLFQNEAVNNVIASYGVRPPQDGTARRLKIVEQAIARNATEANLTFQQIRLQDIDKAIVNIKTLKWGGPSQNNQGLVWSAKSKRGDDSINSYAQSNIVSRVQLAAQARMLKALLKAARLARFVNSENRKIAQNRANRKAAAALNRNATQYRKALRKADRYGYVLTAETAKPSGLSGAFTANRAQYMQTLAKAKWNNLTDPNDAKALAADLGRLRGILSTQQKLGDMGD